MTAVVDRTLDLEDLLFSVPIGLCVLAAIKIKSRYRQTQRPKEQRTSQSSHSWNLKFFSSRVKTGKIEEKRIHDSLVLCVWLLL